MVHFIVDLVHFIVDFSGLSGKAWGTTRLLHVALTLGLIRRLLSPRLFTQSKQAVCFSYQINKYVM
jgi:uncharacterized membrane protein YtjA (UPF0391 family)